MSINGNFEDIFNKNVRDIYWENPKRKSEIIENFDSACQQYAAAALCDHQLKGWKKNQMGYRGVGKSGGLNSGLCSKNALNQLMKYCTWDHVIGAYLIGETIEDLLIKNGHRVKYVLDNCLYDHLYLWGKIKVTKDEHKGTRIIRDRPGRRLTLEKKKYFEHYNNVPLCIDKVATEKLKKKFSYNFIIDRDV